MPVLRPCIVRGCTELTTGTRCEHHETQWESRRRRQVDLTGRRGSTAEWLRMREQAITRDRHRCQDCGRVELDIRREGGRLEVHHVDGNALNNELSNLQTLCSLGCHRVADMLVRQGQRTVG